MGFGDKLKKLRESAGLTQEQLASSSGLPIGSIRNYEQGQREPLWSVVFKLADALRVSVEVFAEAIEPAPAAKGRKKKK